jgi:hypothetical protein
VTEGQLTKGTHALYQSKKSGWTKSSLKYVLLAAVSRFYLKYPFIMEAPAQIM